MVEDRKIAWPAQLSLGADGMGNSLEHVRHIMGQSMEALIHHFKLVTEGFRVPAGQVYVPIESPRGELGYHVVSDGSTRPWRVHVRDPSFVNLQATAAMSEGGMIADVIAADRLDRPRDGRRRPVSALPGSAEGTAVTGLDSAPVEPAHADLPPLTEQTRLEAREIIARYPVARSALLPMLHLVQSVQGYVSPEGVTLCAEELGLTKAEVGAVATFYTMYKRRPTGRHLVSVCTNTLCSVLGGQRIMDALSERPRRRTTTRPPPTARSPSSTPSAWPRATTRRWSPSTTSSTTSRTSRAPASSSPPCAAARSRLPTRGAPLTDFKGISRQLAGFSQYGDDAAAAAAVDAPGALGPTLVGLRLAEDRGETAPDMPRRSATRRPPPRPRRRPASSPRSAAPPSRAGRSLADRNDGTDTPAGTEPGTSGQGPGKA